MNLIVISARIYRQHLLNTKITPPLLNRILSYLINVLVFDLHNSDYNPLVAHSYERFKFLLNLIAIQIKLIAIDLEPPPSDFICLNPQASSKLTIPHSYYHKPATGLKYNRPRRNRLRLETQ